jgi:hypothetical protein
MASLVLSGMAEVKAMLAQLNGQMREVDRYSQNAMAFDIYKGQQEQMRQDLDRPTAWSVGALRYKKAYEAPIKAGDGAPAVEGAAVYMANAFEAGSAVGPDEWLGVQIVAGGKTAGPRRSEKALQLFGWMPKGKIWVPAVGAPRNASGDVPGSLISDMLTNLGTNPYGRKTTGPTETKYVLIGDPGEEEGVWRLVRGQWEPFIWFVDPATYRKRYDFYGRAEREIQAKFLGHLNRYLDIAIRKAAEG